MGSKGPPRQTEGLAVGLGPTALGHVPRRRPIRGEIVFVLADGVAVLYPTVRVALWVPRENEDRALPTGGEALGSCRELLEVASEVMPPVPTGVFVETVPPEEALVDQGIGSDQCRLRIRAAGRDPMVLRFWGNTFWKNLRNAGVIVSRLNLPGGTDGAA